MQLRDNQLEQLFHDFDKLKVLIIGDVMVDAYYWGKVNRISPEAPVPIVAVEKKEERMGGAANVALNVQALGAQPIVCSVIGNDDTGLAFLKLLDQNRQVSEGLLQVENRRTTKKTRIIGNNHQMLPIASEEDKPLDSKTEEDFTNLVLKNIEKFEVDVVIFEDYDKGVISKKLIESVVKHCLSNNIPTAVDPKKRNYTAYQKVSLFKPNLHELKSGLKIDFDGQDKMALEKAIQQQEKLLKNSITLITLSEQGVFIKSSQESHHIQAHLRDITDVSGAGDTVISVAALCLALKTSIRLMGELSNLAGGLVCEYVGVIPIDKTELLSESKRLLSLNL